MVDHLDTSVLSSISLSSEEEPHPWFTIILKKILQKK